MMGVKRLYYIHGHRTLKAPHPVRSAQLTRVPPSQYHGGGPRGNPGCCGYSIFFFEVPRMCLGPVREDLSLCVVSSALGLVLLDLQQTGCLAHLFGFKPI